MWNLRWPTVIDFLHEAFADVLLNKQDLLVVIMAYICFNPGLSIHDKNYHLPAQVGD